MTKKLPKNLNVKIGTKKEAAWTRVKDSLIAKQIDGEIERVINKAILELAIKEIKKEKDL